MVKKFLVVLTIMLGITQLTSAMQNSPTIDSLFSWKYVGIASAVTVGSVYAYSFINYVTSMRNVNKICAKYDKLNVQETIGELGIFYSNKDFATLIEDKINDNLEVNSSNKYDRTREVKLIELQKKLQALLLQLKECVEDISVFTSINSQFQQLLHAECQKLTPIKHLTFTSSLHTRSRIEALWHLPITQIKESLGASIERSKKTSFFKKYILFSGFTHKCNDVYLDMISSYHTLQTYAKISSGNTSGETLNRAFDNYNQLSLMQQPSTSGSTQD